MEDAGIVQLYWDRDESAIPETANKYGNYCFSVTAGVSVVTGGFVTSGTSLTVGISGTMFFGGIAVSVLPAQALRFAMIMIRVMALANRCDMFFS